MVLYLVKHMENFNFTFYFITVPPTKLSDMNDIDFMLLEMSKISFILESCCQSVSLMPHKFCSRVCATE
jgi:hypothetical protein